jgi:hypothetical protein
VNAKNYEVATRNRGAARGTRCELPHVVKLAILALLILPSLASADDTVPNVGDIHVGMSGFSVASDAAPASGAGLYADAEAGWRVGKFDLTGFGAYATHQVNAHLDDGSGTNDNVGDYRMHVLDLGLRATLRGQYVYGGVGVAFENEIDSGTMKTPSGAMPVNDSDQHIAGELRLGGTVEHIDVSASVTVGSAFDYPLVIGRLGVGYRF